MLIKKYKTNSSFFFFENQQNPPGTGRSLLTEGELEGMGLAPMSTLRDAIEAVETQRRESLTAKRAFVLLQNKVRPMAEALMRGDRISELLRLTATIAYTNERENSMCQVYRQQLDACGVLMMDPPASGMRLPLVTPPRPWRFGDSQGMTPSAPPPPPPIATMYPGPPPPPPQQSPAMQPPPRSTAMPPPRPPPPPPLLLRNRTVKATTVPVRIAPKPAGMHHVMHLFCLLKKT